MALLAGAIVIACAVVLVTQLVQTKDTRDKRADAVAGFDGFEKKLTTAHNRGVRQGNALVNCWNSAATPQRAAQKCARKCGVCTRTANTESTRLKKAYRRAPGYVRRVYRGFYRAEIRHLAAVADLGTITRRALAAVERGDVAGFFARYQDEARRMPLRVMRLEARVDTAARRALGKRTRYLQGLS